MNKDILSQEEINMLLSGSNGQGKNNSENKDDSITEVEKDALGEIGNISMGTAATTLSTLINEKVTITTPKVAITTASKLADEYQIPFVATNVTYKEGLKGSNVLILKVNDVKIITDMMMGKTEIDVDRELTELDLSAVSEAMNQMMGSASTSLSEIFSRKIDIEPPKAYEITFAEGRKQLDILKSDDPIVKVSFNMKVGDIIDSDMMQLIPLDFGKETVDKLLGEESSTTSSIIDEDKELNVEETQFKKDEPAYEEESSTLEEDSVVEKEDTVVVKKPKFETFKEESKVKHKSSIDLVGDIPVEIVAELGRATKYIGEILEYGPGTIIELDKLVGEPLNIYANGKFIAKGEVVVIDDNFGIRIKDIPNPYRIED